MKAIFALLVLLSIVPVSIITMIWGWGLEPKNWGWLAFGYLWLFMPIVLAEINKKQRG